MGKLDGVVFTGGISHERNPPKAMSQRPSPPVRQAGERQRMAEVIDACAACEHPVYMHGMKNGCSVNEVYTATYVGERMPHVTGEDTCYCEIKGIEFEQ